MKSENDGKKKPGILSNIPIGQTIAVFIIIGIFFWILAASNFTLPETRWKEFLASCPVSEVSVDTISQALEVDNPPASLVFAGSGRSKSESFYVSGAIPVTDFFLIENFGLFWNRLSCNGTQVEYADSNYTLTVKHLSIKNSLSWAKGFNAHLTNVPADLMLLDQKKSAQAVKVNFDAPLSGREVFLVGYKIVGERLLLRYKIKGRVLEFNRKLKSYWEIANLKSKGLDFDERESNAELGEPEYCLRIPNEFYSQTKGLSGSGIWLMDDFGNPSVLVSQLSCGHYWKPENFSAEGVALICFSAIHRQEFESAVSGKPIDLYSWPRLKARFKKFF